MCLRSDSFDERFCDDLCEEVLQYLPLKDKLRLECISKQFQKTVFKKQNKVILEVELKESLYQRCFTSSYEPNVLRIKYSLEYQVVHQMDPQSEVTAFESCYQKPIESLLKKCSNIQSIDLMRFHSNNSQISKLMIQMITKYCNHLIEFKGMPFYINDCIEIQEFCRKFGPKLKYFGSVKDVFDFNLFPNIETIEEYRVFESNGTEEFLQLNPLNHLKKLEIAIYVNKEHFLPQLIQKFQKLTHLNLWLITRSLKKAFKNFPSHQNLKDLFITFVDIQKIKRMCYSLKQIAIKCPKIKRIVLNSTIVLKNISEAKQLFQVLKAFPSLKRLYIILMDRTGLQTTNDWFSFELFNGFPQQFTHLSLGFCEKPLNESVLKDIDIYLPKLQYLHICGPLMTDTKGLTQMADILSRLSSLQTIKLEFEEGVDYQPIKAMIIEKCPKIKTIIFS